MARQTAAERKAVEERSAYKAALSYEGKRCSRCNGHDSHAACTCVHGCGSGRCVAAEADRTFSRATPFLGAPRTFEVTLNARDAAFVLSEAEDEYRTPEQQVGWIVSNALKGIAQKPVPRITTASPFGFDAEGSGPAPELIPVYHTETGCGRVGLLFRRRLGVGDSVLPGDVFKTDGTQLAAGENLVCGACGGAMHADKWSYEL